MRSPSRDTLSRARLLMAAAVVAVVVTGPVMGATSAQFVTNARAGTTVATRAACSAGTPYATALTSPTYLPSLWWRFANLTATPTVTDASGHGATGTRTGTGVTFGTANAGLVACDTTYAMRQAGAAGSTGFVATTTPRTAPTTLTIATWVRSTALTGGRIVGFGDSSTAGSTRQDRALLLNRSGRVVFHVATSTGNLLLTSPAAITDNVVHLVVATMTPTTAALYVDGTRVATASFAALAPTYTGYWRAGWDQNVATLIPTARNQANVRQDELAVWEGRSLSSAEVAGIYATNHW